MNGADALEAMILAISMIEIDLQLIARHRTGKLLWSVNNDGGLGLLEDSVRQFPWREQTVDTRDGGKPET
jgi:hypothetical protein